MYACEYVRLYVSRYTCVYLCVCVNLSACLVYIVCLDVPSYCRENKLMMRVHRDTAMQHGWNLKQKEANNKY